MTTSDGHYRHYLRDMLRVYSFHDQGKFESEEADELRDSMEEPWYGMSEQEQKRIRGLAIDLNYNRAPKCNNELPPEAGRSILATASELRDAGMFDEALELVRESQDVIFRPSLSLFRGQTWMAMNENEVAQEFFRDADEHESIGDERGADMNVILTWSQKGSHEIAMYLREWLVQVVPLVKPWVSSEDIQKGKKWFPELMAKFCESRVSITCITPENVKSPWVYYEVGLIAARQDEGIVCPYLVGVAGKHIQGTPLAEFQWTEADKSDTWKLIKSINKELKEQALDEKVLEGNFNSHWPRLKAKLEKLIGEMGEVEDDVTQVVQTRWPTLREPAKQLLLEASKDPQGTILALRTSEGYHMQTNGKDLVGSHDPKLIAKWKGALDELRGYGYVEDRGHKGEVFSLTDIGYEYAAELEANDPIFSLSDEAKQLLANGAESHDGLIHFVNNDAGFRILANCQEFVPMNKPAEAAKWKHGLDQLRQRDFVEEAGDEGTFRVTKAGFEAAEKVLEKH